MTAENEKQCEYEFAPGVRCMMVARHDEPYRHYLDYGQWGEYSKTLSAGSRHQVVSEHPVVPDGATKGRSEDLPTYPLFAPSREVL